MAKTKNAVSIQTYDLSIPVCLYFDNELSNIIIGQFTMNIQYVNLLFEIITNPEITDSPVSGVSIKPERTQKINSETAELLITKVITYIENEKPYLDESCCIQSVAKNTDIPPYLLSNLLNFKLQKSFSDFINGYRVQTAQQMILSALTEKLTIESIAHDCGFGSKSNFNRTFKKHSNNLTPSEYIKQHKPTEL